MAVFGLALFAASCSGSAGGAVAPSAGNVSAASAPAVSAAGGTGTAPNASSADDFVGSIGINTHLSYDNTVYGRYLTKPAPNGTTIVSALETLGVRHIRDGSMNTGLGAYRCPIYRQLFAAGIDVDAVIAKTASVADVADMARCLGPALFALEGPNELDAGMHFDPAFAPIDASEMQMLRGARGAAFPARVRLFGPTTVEAQSDKALAAIDGDVIGASIDDANGHVYFGDHNPESAGWGGNFGFGPYGALATDIASMEFVSPGKPYVSSETGYTDTSTSSTSVSPATKATYLLRDLLLHRLLGAQLVYIYELAPADQSWAIMDQHLNPSPSFTAIENVIAILKDPGPALPAQHLGYTLDAASDVDHIAFAKRDGSFWLVLWQTDAIADPNTGKPLTVASTTATVTLARVPAALNIFHFDPRTGRATVSRLRPASGLQLNVGAVPEILQIGTSAAPAIR